MSKTKSGKGLVIKVGVCYRATKPNERGEYNRWEIVGISNGWVYFKNLNYGTVWQRLEKDFIKLFTQSGVVRELDT